MGSEHVYFGLSGGVRHPTGRPSGEVGPVFGPCTHISYCPDRVVMTICGNFSRDPGVRASGMKECVLPIDDGKIFYNGYWYTSWEVLSFAPPEVRERLRSFDENDTAPLSASLGEFGWGTLCLMVGLPYSGKSTLVRQILKNPVDDDFALIPQDSVAVVNPDSIRLAIHGRRYRVREEGLVWYIARIMVESLFRVGHSHVILDATNVTRTQRDRWKDWHWRRVYKVMDTSVETCINRAKSHDDEGMVRVIERMAQIYEPVEEDERDIPYGCDSL